MGNKKHRKTEKFWMVLVEGAENPPEIHHYNIHRATKEARRLARLTGKRTYVLQALKGYQKFPESSVYEIFKTDQIRVKGPAQPPKGTVPNPPKVKQPKHQVQSQPKPEMAAAPKKPKPEKAQMAKPEPSPKENKAPVVIVKKRRIAAMPEEIA